MKSGANISSNTVLMLWLTGYLRPKLPYPILKGFYRHAVYSCCPGITAHLLPCTVQAFRFIDLSDNVLLFLVLLLRNFSSGDDCRVMVTLLSGTGHPLTSCKSFVTFGDLATFGCPLFRFSGSLPP